MKKSVLVVLLAVLVVACAPRTTTEQPQAQDFRSGTEGIVMSFVPNLPPPEVYEGEPLQVMVQVENKGTYSVDRNSGKIHLSGYDPSFLSIGGPDGVGWGYLPRLEGRGPFLPQGGIDTLTFESPAVSGLSGANIDKYEPTILATACYKYQTLATAQVCLDPKPFAPTSQDKVCTPSTVSLGSQGAPVAVTRVEVEPAPDKTRFRIYLANVGGGDLFKEGSLPACDPRSQGLRFDELDYVKVNSVTLSGRDLTDCKPLDGQQMIRLINGQATLFCSATVQQQGAYLAPLNIELEYGYRSTIAKKITIRAIQSGP